MHQCGGGSSDNEPKLGMPIVDTFPMECTASPFIWAAATPTQGYAIFNRFESLSSTTKKLACSLLSFMFA